MKTIQNKYLKFVAIITIVATTLVSCERDLSEDVVLATFPITAEVFTDNFVGMGSDFYFPYADGFAKLETFEVDSDVAYEGSASLRIDVPNSSDPAGVYVGANYRIDGAGRDLSGYNALTFWARSTTAPVIQSLGFGQSETQDYETSISNIQLSTAWQKIVIPIPDPSKLTQEKGMLWMVANPKDGDGYSFWIDELKFENLGTLGQERPKMLGGADADFISVPGQTLSISGFTYTANQSNGQDVTVTTTGNYYEFSSSNTSVATVNDQGLVTVVSTGEAQITATVNGIPVIGSVNVRSFEDERIISLFSDFYASVPVDNYNGFYEPFQTTLGGLVNEGGNNIIDYTMTNFVAMEFYGRFNPNAMPVDATEMTNISIDIRVNESVAPSDFVRLELINNFGQGQTSGTYTISGADLRPGEWVSFNIPLADFTGGLANRDAIGALLWVTDNTISNISFDNIFFSKEVIEPTPNVDDSAATQVAVPVGFESTTLNYNVSGFEGAVPSVIANPDPSGINPTATVLSSIKNNGAQFFAGNVLPLESPIDFSQSQKMRMKVWSPKAGIPIRIKLENSGNTAQFVELDAMTTTSNEWEELQWDFSSTNFNVAPLDTVIIFFEFIPNVGGDGSTYYCDDIKIIN